MIDNDMVSLNMQWCKIQNSDKFLLLQTMLLQKLCKSFKDDGNCSRSKHSVDFEELCLKHQCAELLSPTVAASDASFDKQFLYYGIRKVMECINQGHVDVDYIVNDPGWINLISCTSSQPNALFRLIYPDASTAFICPPGLKFHVCGSPVKTCRQLSTYSKYENFHLLGKTCFPGCLCSSGRYFDEKEECILASECPCYDDETGKVHVDGDEVVKDCVIRWGWNEIRVRDE